MLVETCLKQELWLVWHISEVQKSPKRISVGDHLADSTDIENLIESELARLADKNPKPLIVIHSHPQIDDNDPMYAKLSADDLDAWFYHACQRDSFLFIGGTIFIPKKGDCELLLIQGEPGKEISNIYQQWQQGDGMGYLFDLLERSHIRFTKLDFDLSSGFDNKQIETLNWQVTS